MRVVLDTNIFVSSFFGGNLRKIIDLWRAERFVLCLSGPILEEYINVLGRLGLKNDRELDEIVSLLSKGFNLLFTASPPEERIVKDDPADDKFFACARALGADYIVSGDKQVLKIGTLGPIRVVNAAGFLDMYEKGT